MAIYKFRNAVKLYCFHTRRRAAVANKFIPRLRARLGFLFPYRYSKGHASSQSRCSRWNYMGLSDNLLSHDKTLSPYSGALELS